MFVGAEDSSRFCGVISSVVMSCRAATERLSGSLFCIVGMEDNARCVRATVTNGVAILWVHKFVQRYILSDGCESSKYSHA